MLRGSLSGIVFVLSLLLVKEAPHAQTTAEQVNQGIVGVIAGSIDGTSMHAASDLAAVLDDGNRLRILPIQGKGSVQAITDLLYLRGIDLAIIQRDALEYSRRENIHTNIQGRIRYISKLFNEEIHVVARRDIATIQDLRGLPVNIGVPGSGSDLTATLLLDALDLDVQIMQDDHQLALQKLIAGEISGMIYIGGKPTPLFQHVSEDKGLHLLPIDYTPQLLDLYLPASLDDVSYPGLVAPGERIDTLAVEAILAVYNWPEGHERREKVERFIDAYFSNLEQLQQPPRHRKWQDVNLTADLPNWERFAPAQDRLSNFDQAVADAGGPLRDGFDRFLQERNLDAVPDDLKETLFAEFLRWQGGQSLTFALVPKAVNNAFFTVAHDGCKQAQSELQNVECLYIGPGEHTDQEQAQILQDLIDRGINGIAVSPTNSPLMAGVLRRAQEAGIPVITWDSDLEEQDQDLRLTYIGSDNYEIGVEIARQTQKLRPNGGTICILTGAAGAANTNRRMQGIRDTLSGVPSAEAPGERLIGQGGWTESEECPLAHNSDVATAMQQLSQLLVQRPELDAILSIAATPQRSDPDFRAVVEPYRQRLDSGQLVMIMADTLPMQMEQLRDGLTNVQVGQRPYEMGYRAMYVLQDLANGKQALEDPIITALDVCTRDTIDSCIFGQGGPSEGYASGN